MPGDSPYSLPSWGLPFWLLPTAYQIVVTRSTRSFRVIFWNFFAPLDVNCMRTIGSFVVLSKSGRVPFTFRSEPVISGVGFDLFCGS